MVCIEPASRFSLLFLFFFITFTSRMRFFSMTIFVWHQTTFYVHYLILNLVTWNGSGLSDLNTLGLFLTLIGLVWYVMNLYPSKFIQINCLGFLQIIFSLAFYDTIFFLSKIFNLTRQLCSTLYDTGIIS